MVPLFGGHLDWASQARAPSGEPRRCRTGVSLGERTRLWPRWCGEGRKAQRQGKGTAAGPLTCATGKRPCGAPLPWAWFISSSAGIECSGIGSKTRKFPVSSQPPACSCTDHPFTFDRAQGLPDHLRTLPPGEAHELARAAIAALTAYLREGFGEVHAVVTIDAIVGSVVEASAITRAEASVAVLHRWAGIPCVRPK